MLVYCGKYIDAGGDQLPTTTLRLDTIKWHVWRCRWRSTSYCEGTYKKCFSTCSLRTAHWDTTETPPRHHRSTTGTPGRTPPRPPWSRRPSTFRVNNPKLPLLGNHPFIVGIDPPLAIWGAIIWGCPNSWGYQWVPQISSKSWMTISEYWKLWWLGMF